MVTVYVMFHPIYKKRAIYVGATQNFSARKSQHLNKIKNWYVGCKALFWYEKLYNFYINYNKLPEFVIDCVVENEFFFMAEGKCIKKYSNAGYNLYNKVMPPDCLATIVESKNEHFEI